jgi:hypothetical protein
MREAPLSTPEVYKRNTYKKEKRKQKKKKKNERKEPAKPQNNNRNPHPSLETHHNYKKNPNKTTGTLKKQTKPYSLCYD